jgi:hypothetical protein
MHKSGSRPKIIVSGILFWYPLAGVTFQFLHYLLALRRLGYDPYYVEDSGRYVYDPTLNDLTPTADRNVRAVAAVLEDNGFASRWAFRGAYPGGKCFGLDETALLALYREADALLNVTGAQELREEHMSCRRRIYVESDPFASQVRAAQGDASILAALAAHDTHFSFGENLGSPDCDVPATPGVVWRPTRQPVVLDLWRHQLPPGDRYTTITTWHNEGKEVRYRGETYHWTKDREFEKVIDLPLRATPAKAAFELAVTADATVRERLRLHGWGQTDALAVSGDIHAYRQYIQGSRGELTVARDQYTRPHTGWFSDRTACYLAAGRPVITQETGFSKVLPTGRGLFAWRTIDDILAAVETIEANYALHCEAAAEIATEFFAAEKVVGRLMAEAGL